MLTDDTIAGILRGRIANSNGFIDNKASLERIKVNEYLSGKLPAPMHKGNSRYVSNDVFDSTESMKAQLIETFCGSYETVRFMPQGADDVEKARIDTEVCNFVVNRQNNGFQMKQDVIHDGLTARIGVAKVWWEKSEEETEETFEGSLDDFAAYMAKSPDAEPTEADMGDDGSTLSATFKHTKDTSQVKIMTIPPEEFLYSGGARGFEDANLLAHRTQHTVSEIEAMFPDVPRSRLEGLPSGTEWIISNVERIERADMENALTFMEREDEEAGRLVEVFECYTKIDMSGSKGRSARRLWKITVAGNEILDKEEVKRVPFIGFVPLPKAHTIKGDNFAARIIPTQNARTALMRSIIDHAVITTNPRHTVLRNGLMDPRELLENRIGGVVNINKPDAIGVLPQAGLNPFVFQTIGQLDMDREEVTGISKLSQGLNKDAISTQNSGSMVEQLISVSQIRQKVIARRFGEFIKSLYMLVNQLVVENADKQFSIELAGDWVQVDPSMMSMRKDVSLDVSLGYGEKEKEATKYLMIDKYLAGDPRIAPYYTGPERYTVLTRTLQAMGVKDVSSILKDPSKTPPPPPNPQMQLDMAKTKAETDLATAQAQVMTQKLQMEAQKLQMEHELKMAHQQLELQKLQNQHALEVRKQDFKEAIDTAEMRLAVETEANAQTLIQTPKV